MSIPTSQFSYATARVRALEPQLLDPSDLERMLGAKTAQEAYKILNDSDYASHMGDIEKVEEFQILITAGLLDAKEVLDRIIPEPKILDLLFLPYDFHNIKTLVKGLARNKGQEEIRSQLMPLGRISIEALEAFFYEKNHGHLPLDETYVDIIKQAIQKANAHYEKTADPRWIDLVVDQALYQLMTNIANTTGNRFVIAFVAKGIDLANLKSLLRVKLLKQENSFMENHLTEMLFAPGGTVATYKFRDALEMDRNTLVNTFKGTDYEALAAKGLDAYEKHKSFIYLEKYAEEFLLGFIRSARYIDTGPEAILAYYFGKQNNARIVRLIMVGKLSHVPEEELRAKLNTLYT